MHINKCITMWRKTEIQRKVKEYLMKEHRGLMNCRMLELDLKLQGMYKNWKVVALNENDELIGFVLENCQNSCQQITDVRHNSLG